MDDAQRKLLEDRKTIILPEEINHDVYELIVEAAIRYSDDEIDLYCNGEGGYSGDAFAIVDVIKSHGKFVGLLLGAVVSSHALVWAACPTRYFYQSGKLGLHRVIVGSISAPMDGGSLQQKADNHAHIDRASSDIFAGASNRESQQWYDMIARATLGMVWLYADEIMACEMGLPIANRIDDQIKSHGLSDIKIETRDWMPGGVMGMRDMAGNIAAMKIKPSDGK